MLWVRLKFDGTLPGSGTMVNQAGRHAVIFHIPKVDTCACNPHFLLKKGLPFIPSLVVLVFK